jgi:hypothetical protein
MEEIKRGQNFLDTVDDLFTFGDGDKQRSEHFIYLKVGLLIHDSSKE